MNYSRRLNSGRTMLVHPIDVRVGGVNNPAIWSDRTAVCWLICVRPCTFPHERSPPRLLPPCWRRWHVSSMRYMKSPTMHRCIPAAPVVPDLAATRPVAVRTVMVRTKRERRLTIPRLTVPRLTVLRLTVPGRTMRRGTTRRRRNTTPTTVPFVASWPCPSRSKRLRNLCLMRCSFAGISPISPRPSPIARPRSHPFAGHRQANSGFLVEFVPAVTDRCTGSSLR